MNIIRRCTVVVCVALLAALAIPKAMASEWDKATKVTFNTPVEVPGAVLQPGTYLLTVLPDSDGNVVQIWNEDHTKLYATAFTQPDSSVKPSDKPVLLFEKSPTNPIPVAKAWFYPGEPYARAFVYPKSKATELAKRTKQPVRAMPDDKASTVNTQAKSGKEIPLATIVVTQILPSGEEVSKR